jgi:Zn-finger in ubiquitin-hydrolases and other protein
VRNNHHKSSTHGEITHHGRGGQASHQRLRASAADRAAGHAVGCVASLCNRINTETNGERRAIARQLNMATFCKHLSAIRDVIPSAFGCEECLKLGDPWLHLRICRSCGHVGCCDQSPNRHATKHFHATKHPIIEAYDPPEGWGWCYVDEVMFDLSGRQTPHLGPIPRFY